MYNEPLNFSTVTLPGVGGSINAATAISTDKLQEMNQRGSKWRIDKHGNLTFFDEAVLKGNQAQREKRANLVNRDRNENASGTEAMKEIMSRKRARKESFQELKRREYASDLDVLSIPQPFSECDCKAPGKCNCPSCRKKAEKEQAFREWDTDRRKKLLAGEVKGEFAGPNMSFPISSPEDVSAAWSSVGRAANPRKVMAEIIRISKKHGWERGLPQSVKDRLAKGESGLPSPNFNEGFVDVKRKNKAE